MDDGSTGAYTYDGDGQRVKKSGGTLYWRSLSGEILAESDLSGTITREYVYFAGRRIARRDDPSGNVYYFLQDHLGSTRVVTNQGGSVVRDSDYYPHGTEKLVSGTVDDPHKFAGMYLDSESGLYYTWFRMYAPNLGRWLAPDPVAGSAEEPGSLNRYAYVMNDPVNLVDPLGLDCKTPDGRTVPCPEDTSITVTGAIGPPVHVSSGPGVMGYASGMLGTCTLVAFDAGMVELLCDSRIRPSPQNHSGASGGERPRRGAEAPSIQEVTARVHGCAAARANTLSVASILGVENVPVANVIFSNTISSASQLVYESEPSSYVRGGASVVGSLKGADYAAKSVRVAGQVEVNEGFQSIFTTVSAVKLGETEVGRAAATITGLGAKALGAFFKYFQAPYDAVTYTGALVSCSEF